MGVKLTAIWEDARIEGIDQTGQIYPVVPIGLEVGDTSIGQLGLNPIHQALICWFAEV